MKFEEGVNVTFIGVGDGGRGARAPLKFGKKFSGNFYVKFRHFSGKNHVKLGNFLLIFLANIKMGYFDNFLGKNYLKFGQFVYFSYIFFGQKCHDP